MSKRSHRAMGRRPLSVGVLTPLEEFCAKAQEAEGPRLLGQAPTFFGANSNQHPAFGQARGVPAWAAAVAARGEHAMRTRTGPFRPGPGEASFGAARMPTEHRAGVDLGGGSRRLVVGGGSDAMPMRWNRTQGWHHDEVGCQPGTMGSIARFNQARYTAERRGLAGGTEVSLVGGVPNLVGGMQKSLVVGGTEVSLVGGRRLVVGAARMTPAQEDDLLLMMQNALRATGIVRAARPSDGTAASRLVERQLGDSRTAASRLSQLFSAQNRPKAASDLSRLLFHQGDLAAAQQAQQAAQAAVSSMFHSAPPSGGGGGGGGADVSFDASVDVDLPKPPPPPSASASASFNVSGGSRSSHYMRLRNKRPL